MEAQNSVMLGLGEPNISRTAGAVSTSGKTPPKPLPPKFALTDSGNAELMSHLYRGTLLYDALHKKWMFWNAERGRWQYDRTNKVRKLARDAARRRKALTRKAGGDANAEPDAAAYKWAKYSESSKGIDAMLKEAACEPLLADDGLSWDNDPYSLGVENGVLNLKTGKLRRGERSDRISLFSPVTFNPEAKCTLFGKFILEVFDGNEHMVRYIQRWAGYSLTGDVSEKAVSIHHGSGDNGKTTLLKIFQRVLGRDLATIVETSTLDQKHQRLGDGHDLPGKRLAICEETKEAMVIDESRFKLWTGGGTLKCRGMYVNPFDYDPQFKIWMGCNDKPIIRDPSPAMWKRIHCIEYRCQFVDKPTGNQKLADRRLYSKLCAELPGILNWMLAGCLEWQRQGLNPPSEVLSATHDYEVESDHLNAFLDDKCECNPGYSATKSAVQEAYKTWCREAGEKPKSQKQFAAGMSKRFQEGRSNHNTVRVWIGLRLRKPLETPPETPPGGQGGQEKGQSYLPPLRNYLEKENESASNLVHPSANSLAQQGDTSGQDSGSLVHQEGYEAKNLVGRSLGAFFDSAPSAPAPGLSNGSRNQ
ncbi:MAG TPA: phage/plasmid primase, P4 family [Candidatus Acidoferrales bacterium]|nr:phage/plasmid primase, P4 family [Candidatus Acidoferrales bacterium]